jgi:flagellar biosynthetic protein FlhB
VADNDQDKSQDATPHKLQEAKKRGQVAKSMEVNFIAILAALVGVCFAVGPSIASQEMALARSMFNVAGRLDWSLSNILGWLIQIGLAGLHALVPLLVAICVAAILSNVVQIGGVFSFDPIKPDLERINPASGIKRLFSMRMVYEALKNIIKLTILGCVAWVVLKQLLPDMLQLSFIESQAHAKVVLGQVGPLLFKLLLAFLLIALIDLLYTRWDFAKKMRMSHRDVTDEHKQREGDPRIRQRLRQLRNELLKQSRAAQKLPEADVLITNPTHISVAISYRHGEMPAPKLLAKGSGELAAKMRTVARLHNIPVVENPPLARALYKRTDLDEFIPEDLYPKVARILLWVYAMRNSSRAATPRATVLGQTV